MDMMPLTGGTVRSGFDVRAAVHRWVDVSAAMSKVALNRVKR